MISIGSMWQRIKQLKKDMAWSEQILESRFPDELMDDDLLDIRQSEREMGRALGRIEVMKALGVSRVEIPSKKNN
jgi:hypothetical protein